MDMPRITTVTQSPRFNERGGVEQVYRVLFMVGQDGPFQEEFLAGDFTEPKIQAALGRIAATLHNAKALFTTPGSGTPGR
jgi:hypothetical protein